jgi:hypothetical protein
MIEKQEMYFEIIDSCNIVRIEPFELINSESDLDWDRNWIKTKITIKGGAFSGQYLGEFMTVDFEVFKQELTKLYDNLEGTASFNDLEGYLELKIIGDGIGHFEVDVKACDQIGENESILIFSMEFDQTFLNGMLFQLERITNQFPIIGDLNSKNK